MLLPKLKNMHILKKKLKAIAKTESQAKNQCLDKPIWLSSRKVELPNSQVQIRGLYWKQWLSSYLYAFMGGQEEARLDRVCDLGVNHSPWRDVSSPSYRILIIFWK